MIKDAPEGQTQHDAAAESEAKSAMVKCPNCHNGIVRRPMSIFVAKCSTCNGTGRVPK